MNIWEILGIEPCKDKKKITEAYRNKLVETNPEDKPEEFKVLRNAYEETLGKDKVDIERSLFDFEKTLSEGTRNEIDRERK